MAVGNKMDNTECWQGVVSIFALPKQGAWLV